MVNMTNLSAQYVFFFSIIVDLSVVYSMWYGQAQSKHPVLMLYPDICCQQFIMEAVSPLKDDVTMTEKHFLKPFYLLCRTEMSCCVLIFLSYSTNPLGPFCFCTWNSWQGEISPGNNNFRILCVYLWKTPLSFAMLRIQMINLWLDVCTESSWRY